MLNTTGQRQTEVDCEIRVLGIDRWQDCLSNTLVLSGGWEKMLGRAAITELEFAHEYAIRHGLGDEWGIAIQLLNRGYTLNELEIEFVGGGECDSWGRCVWLKEHPSYSEPLPEPFNEHPAIYPPNLFRAMYRTEHAGEQKKSFHSSSFGGPNFTPRKTIVFLKMVFAPPQMEAEESAAA